MPGNVEAPQPPPRPAQRVGWRNAVEKAVEDGKAAEREISDRDLTALLRLPPERRQAVVDRAVPSARLDNLLPTDLRKLRESLSASKSRKKAIDPIQAAAERRAVRMVSLREYIVGYEQEIRDARTALAAAFVGLHIDPDAAAAEATTAYFDVTDLYAVPHPEGFGQLRFFRKKAARARAEAAVYRLFPILTHLIAARKELAALEGMS